MLRQGGQGGKMLREDWKLFEAGRPKRPLHLVYRTVEFPNPLFDNNFPEQNDADEDIVVPGEQRCRNRSFQLLRRGKRPNRHMRVE